MQIFYIYLAAGDLFGYNPVQHFNVVVVVVVATAVTVANQITAPTV